MPFHLTPILEKMEQLYQLPRNRKRFETYLEMLQGKEKQDMILPIAGYNPMGKEFVLEQLRTLISLGAEEIAQEELDRINPEVELAQKQDFQVVINLSDDIGGSWSSRYTTDYTSKFDLSALIKRHFCTPYFWTSEEYTPEMIAERIRGYVLRTGYALENGSAKTLKEHLDQEVFVQSHRLAKEAPSAKKDFESIDAFFQKHQASEDYNLIFNFFYGDKASEGMAYASYGRLEWEGFEYATHLAQK